MPKAESELVQCRVHLSFTLTSQKTSHVGLHRKGKRWARWHGRALCEGGHVTRSAFKKGKALVARCASAHSGAQATWPAGRPEPYDERSSEPPSLASRSTSINPLTYEGLLDSEQAALRSSFRPSRFACRVEAVWISEPSISRTYLQKTVGIPLHAESLRCARLSRPTL